MVRLKTLSFLRSASFSIAYFTHSAPNQLQENHQRTNSEVLTQQNKTIGVQTTQLQIYVDIVMMT